MDLSNVKTIVIACRTRAATLQQRLHEARQAFAETHAALLWDTAAAKVELDEAEDALRQAALAVHAASGNTRPIAGVQIKTLTRLIYDPEDAFTWAERHTCCLALDVKAFEQVAKAIVLPFVEVKKEPQAQLSKDLEA